MKSKFRRNFIAKVTFLCGLAASGKTTFAKKVAAETGAIRLTLDERMIQKTTLTIYDDEYGRLVTIEKELMWQEAQHLLDTGHNVILDWSLWSRRARLKWSQMVIASGHEYLIVYLDIPLALLKQRLVTRNAANAPLTHAISIVELERFSKIFEPPLAEEKLNLKIIQIDT